MVTSYAVVGQKGGSGKSTIARALAVELARKKKSPLLIDADIGQRTVSDWAAARELNDLSPAIEVASLDIGKDADRLAERIASGRTVIVDAPGFSDASTLDIAGMVDCLILPTAPCVDDLRPTARLIHELVAAGIEPLRLCVVLNRGTEAEARHATEMLERAGIAAMAERLRDMAVYRQSQGKGLAITETGSEAAQSEARAVIAAVFKRTSRLSHRETDHSGEQPMRYTGGQW